MNKVFLLCGLTILGSLLSYAQSNRIDYTINGKVRGMESGKIYFSLFGMTGKKDSVEVKKGVFRFKGSLLEPFPVVLSFESNFINKPFFMFFVDQGAHKVTLNKADLQNSEAKGPPATRDYELLKSREKPLNDYVDSVINKLGGDTSSNASQLLDSIISVYYYRRKDLVEQFIKNRPSTATAVWATHHHFNGDPGLAQKLEELYKILPPKYLSTSYGREMKEAVEKNKALSIGSLAPNFTQNDTLDRPVSLTDFKGKYVLLDFWASWCVPCRKDNPNVVKAFQSFKDKNFTVLSVSLDMPGQKAAWLRAIHADGLTWTHVSDLKWWDNEAAKLYGVKAVPANLLIGPDGKIVAKNLHGGELEKTLQELIK